MNQPRLTWNFPLDKDFYACERGNTWLQRDDLHVAWFKLDDNHFLEVAVEPQNYPGFKVAVIVETEKQLAEHIRTKCEGWFVHKCNTQGVAWDEENQVLNPHVQFEYDRNFTGGEYNLVGDMAYVPFALVRELGPEKAFEQQTGLNPMHIVHYSLDELCDGDGGRIDVDGEATEQED